MVETRKVKRKGGELELCKCPTCGAWHVKAKEQKRV